MPWDTNKSELLNKENNIYYLTPSMITARPPNKGKEEGKEEHLYELNRIWTGFKIAPGATMNLSKPLNFINLGNMLYNLPIYKDINMAIQLLALAEMTDFDT